VVDAVTIVAHDVAGVGGMERQLQALVSGLLERGVRVTVVSRTLDVAAHERLRWFRVPGPARPFVLAHPWFAVAASVVLLRAKSGVLHTTGAIVFNRADVCTVHYLHTGRGGTVARARRETVPYRLNHRFGRLLARAAERSVLGSNRRAGLLVAVSERLAKEVRQAFPHRARDVRVIPHGVDAGRFRSNWRVRADVRSSLGLGKRDFAALFVGSEWRGKGLGVAVDALSRTSDARLVVVGDGDRQEIERRATALGVEGRVLFVGETDTPERFYAAADAFVLPSEYETFSLAAFEAAAAGLPVIATRVGAVDDLVEAGAAVAVERDPHSVAAALETLMASETRRRSMGHRGREAARRYRWESSVDAYLDAYALSAGVARR
jgi:UDP-glucose:(heptosyl)LPS alpha-1,3-glucosyltransferase